MASVDPFTWVSGDKISGVVSSATTITLYFLIALFGTVFVWGIFYLLSFKHKVRVRQRTGSGYVVVDTKARQFKTKDGITKWRLLKYIGSASEAPKSEYLEITKRGKLCAECDRSLDGSVVWRKRGVDTDSLDVLSPEERSMALMQMRAAVAEYRKTGVFDKVMQLLPIIIPIVVLVILVAFWSDLTQPAVAASGAIADASSKLADASNNLASACLNRPVLNGSTVGNVNVLTTPPG